MFSAVLRSTTLRFALFEDGLDSRFPLKSKCTHAFLPWLPATMQRLWCIPQYKLMAPNRKRYG